MELVKQNNKQVALSTPAASSQRLIQCLIDLEVAEKKSEAKMELVLMANELMPAGQPQYLSVIKYPTIRALIEKEGKKKILAILVLLVKDFCSSVNVVRNMNEDQMIEAGAMLMEECGNFRMEDYVMMFNMAKRGSFPEVKIMDRIDIQLISGLMDAYWSRRAAEGRKALDAEVGEINENPNDRKNLTWNGKNYEQEVTMTDKFHSLGDAIGNLRDGLKQNGIERENTDVK